MKKIAVIGAGWYGCHIARVLALKGFDVTLFESGANIFTGISGNFGVRLHKGPHYPRSEKTRKDCRAGYAEFIKTYPDLIVKHAYSIYALGKLDANNEPPKIDEKTFNDVARENEHFREIDPDSWGYEQIASAFDIEEPSILVGNLLRDRWKSYLHAAGVKVICDFKVQRLVKKNDKICVTGNFCLGIFDYAVNTTSYHDLLPPPDAPLPYDLDVIYQPCLALMYEDKLSREISLPPFSFIVMDGWFPCIMPYIENNEKLNETKNSFRKYILTHGKYTIMGSFKTITEAQACLEKIDDAFVKAHVQTQCEEQMQRFWPLFHAGRRFQYVGWKAAVLAKIKTNREFRSAVMFARDQVAYVIPGKISNVFDAGREVELLINHQQVLQQGAYEYVKGGILHEAMTEITEAIDPKLRNTCHLQTYSEITSAQMKQRVLSQKPSVEILTSGEKIADNKQSKSSHSISFFQPTPMSVYPSMSHSLDVIPKTEVVPKNKSFL